MNTQKKKVAIITGASKGLGLALARTLAQQNWTLLINARNPQELFKVQKELAQSTEVIAISGDVRDEVHLLQFEEQVQQLGHIDLIINNASTIGPSPQPKLLDYPVEALHQIFHTNVIAPLSLLQKVKPFLQQNAVIINLSSDAAVEAYENWGGYGSSKAALDHWTAILAKEYPEYHIYSIDPGDMRTTMHQAAFPGEDISDRPLPESVVPGFIQLLEELPESGRYQVKEGVTTMSY